jgi:hypothetical protein
MTCSKHCNFNPAQLSVKSDVIKVRNARIANRINLHLALGDSFETAQSIVPIK